MPALNLDFMLCNIFEISMGQVGHTNIVEREDSFKYSLYLASLGGSSSISLEAMVEKWLLK